MSESAFWAREFHVSFWSMIYLLLNSISETDNYITGCPKKNATDLINLSDEEVH